MIALRKGFTGGGRAFGLTGALVLAALILSLAWPGAARAGGWSPTGSLTQARYGHRATLLNNGQVLVAGGLGSGDTGKSAELYTPGESTPAVNLLLLE